MARAAKARIFRSTQTAPNTSTARDLTTAFGSAANTATVSTMSGVSAQGGMRWNPNTSATIAAIPAAGTAPSGQGWRDTVAEHATEAISYAAGTWTVKVRANKTAMAVNSTVTVRITVIVYRVTSAGAVPANAPNNGEIGRVVMADTDLPTVNSTVAITGSFVTAAATAFDAGDKVQVECYIQNIVAGSPAAAASTYSVAFVVDEASANGANISAIPTYGIVYSRSFAVTSIGVAANPRKAITISPKAVSAVGVAGVSRQGAYARSVAVSAVGVAGVSRQGAYARSVAVSAVGVAAADRALTLARSVAVAAVGVATTSKSVGIARGVVAVGLAGLERRLAAVRSVSATAIGVAATSRTVDADPLAAPIPLHPLRSGAALPMADDRSGPSSSQHPDRSGGPVPM